MSGFGGIQSALDPRGPMAAEIADIAWVLFTGGALIFAGVLALAAWAVFARPRHREWLARHRTVVAGGIVFPVTVLTLLLGYVAIFKTAPHGPFGVARLRIEVTGHQWWWRVRYLDPQGREDFETANEIRIPAGERVELILRSHDVLHSFWVPSLAGKVDMIPGRDNRLVMTGSTTGRFRGQCAEYCGGPHAQMAFFVIVEEPEAFERWRARERTPAAATHSTFLARCASCHTLRGTEARGKLGPDLTHVGSRTSIGAGILPNNAGALAGWIASSQHIKPGNLMPSIDGLGSEELRGLATYLAGLE